MSERRKVLEKFEEQYEYMQERVNSGIEEYRKGDFTITVKNADGKSIENVKIDAKHTEVAKKTAKAIKNKKMVEIKIPIDSQNPKDFICVDDANLDL